MALAFINDYLPKTAKYIDDVFDKEGGQRGGHHNYIITQKVLNAHDPLNAMTETRLADFDNEMVAYLQRIDRPEGE